MHISVHLKFYSKKVTYFVYFAKFCPQVYDSFFYGWVQIRLLDVFSITISSNEWLCIYMSLQNHPVFHFLYLWQIIIVYYTSLIPHLIFCFLDFWKVLIVFLYSVQTAIGALFFFFTQNLIPNFFPTQHLVPHSWYLKQVMIVFYTSSIQHLMLLILLFSTNNNQVLYIIYIAFGSTFFVSLTVNNYGFILRTNSFSYILRRQLRNFFVVLLFYIFVFKDHVNFSNSLSYSHFCHLYINCCIWAKTYTRMRFFYL